MEIKPILELKKELFNYEAEQIILGTIILNNEYLNRVSDFLQPVHFYEPAHQKIYGQILYNIDKANIVANQVTLKHFFESENEIKSLGGQGYIATLISNASAIIDIVNYGKLIYDLSIKRELAMVAEEIAIDVFKNDQKITAENLIEKAEGKLFKLSNGGGLNRDFKKISVSIKETLDKAIIARKRDSHISGVSTGLVDLDKILGGLQNSDLLILAARPSMGKTALAVNIAISACKFLNENIENEKEKKSVGFFSLEMSADQLAARVLSMESSVNATKFRTGQINDYEWEGIAIKSAEIAKLPFYIDDTPALSISALRTRTRRLIRKHNLAFILVDYLQLVKGSNPNQENRVQEISEITQGLKAIAKEFNIPVMALSQLSRAVEQREDKRPQLSDLRESGSIEQDADVVAFIYRDSYYHERKRPPDTDPKFPEWKNHMEQVRHLTEIIIAKQRNGPVGTIDLYFDSEFTKFKDLESNKNDNFSD